MSGVELDGLDASLAQRAVTTENQFAGLAAEVVQLLGDSYELDPTPYQERMGLVFIDANHTRRYVERDTANALRMVPKSGPSAVVWHDYGNPSHPDVTEYLDALSAQEPLHHIEESFLVFRLAGVEVPPRLA